MSGGGAAEGWEAGATIPGDLDGSGLNAGGAHEVKEPGGLASLEECVPGIESGLAVDGEHFEDLAGDVDGSYPAGGDQAAVGHRGLVEIMLAAVITAEGDVFAQVAGVLAGVEEPGARQGERGCADGRHRYTGVEKFAGFFDR